MFKKIIIFSGILIVVGGAAQKKSYFELVQPNQVYPTDIPELVRIVTEANKDNKKISLVGANKSQGGQTSYINSIRVNLSKLNRIVSFRPSEKIIAVQVGMTWGELQKVLAPYRLSVRAMQSYKDFSIGDSLSVNAHGRDVKNNPLIKSVKSFKMLMSNGELLNVSRSENKDLFRLALGGYGLLGIIVEVALDLTDDLLLESQIVVLNSYELVDYFFTHVRNNPSVQFYSARFSLDKNFLEKVIVTLHKKTERGNSNLYNLKSHKLLDKIAQGLFFLMSKSAFIKSMRFGLESIYFRSGKKISRNNFMNCSLEGLPKEDEKNMYILQEYFIPYKNVNKFIGELRFATQSFDINLLNVTARHVNADTESLMAYSPTETCAFVLYIHVNKCESDYRKIALYTNFLINFTLKLNGKYYLPYQLLASRDQFYKSYPNFTEFLRLKKVYDPNLMFVNNFYMTYA
jgi:decaprenylphospho-beta-D-ribofuranose 2-oxidase